MLISLGIFVTQYHTNWPMQLLYVNCLYSFCKFYADIRIYIYGGTIFQLLMLLIRLATRIMVYYANLSGNLYHSTFTLCNGYIIVQFF